MMTYVSKCDNEALLCMLTKNKVQKYSSLKSKNCTAVLIHNVQDLHCISYKLC